MCGCRRPWQEPCMTPLVQEYPAVQVGLIALAVGETVILLALPHRL